MKRTFAVLPIAAAVVLAGCGVSSDESVPPTTSSFKAHFVPLGGLGPFPTDLFFSGSTDGTLNIPVTDPTDTGDYLVAMNALDGYSTTAPIFVPFSAAIDAASITAATVRMINITNPLAPVPLTFGTSFTAGVSTAVDGTSQLMITPVAPLAAKARYAVIVTVGVTGGGAAAVADTTMQAILDLHGEGGTPNGTPPAALAAVFGAVEPLIDLANAFGITDANVAVAFSFATQSTSDVLDTVAANATAQASTLQNTGFTTAQLLGAGPGRANVYVGFVQVPYYLNASAILTGRWQGASGSHLTRFNTTPVATSTQTIPVLVTVPNANSPSAGVKPAGGWPTVIFQHGITGNRTQALAMADAAATAGFAVISIDQPLHGLPVGHALRVPGVGERTFDADVSNNATRAPGADGTIDTSGQNYINLSSLLTSRDNLRQSAADLASLSETAPTMNYDGIAGGDFDASRIHFVGHSLGGIVGTTFLGVSNNAAAAVLGMPGGTIARLLRDSPTFSVSINAGLAANGVVNGSQLYEQFMQAAQTVVDSGDPINYAAAATANHAILLFQVVGDGGASLPDQVVPNSATTRLATALGLTRVSADTLNAGGNRVFVNFTAGDHGSILSPAASAAANAEMQSQMATFLGSNGALVDVTDGTVIQP